MSMPTAWTDLDWTKATPLDHRYLYSLWQAVAERRHVVRRHDAGVNAFLARRHPGQTPARAEFTALRDAIYAVCDRFIRLDADYAADGWDTWPVLWDQYALVGDETRNIALMPDSTDHIAAWGDWMRRAKGCLDALVCSRYSGCAISGLYATHNVAGDADANTHQTVAAAVSDAIANSTATARAAPQGPVVSVLSLEVSRTRQRHPGPPVVYSDLWYNAWSNQRLGWRWVNLGQVGMVPRLVAVRHFAEDDYYFDGFGQFFLGDSNATLAGGVLAPGATRVIDASTTVRSADVAPAPALPVPVEDPNWVTQATTRKFATCALYTYFDYRCAGGFQFYTPEEI